MNSYQQSFIDRFPKTQSKAELKRVFNMCCDGLRDKEGREIVHGCHNAIYCEQQRCPVYKEYMIWLNIIDEVRKPKTIIVEKEPEKRKYNISPEKRMVQNAKKDLNALKGLINEEELQKINNHLTKGHFAWALKAAQKNKLNKVVKMITPFIKNNNK